MGDGGTMFLGFTLAALAVARQRQASNVFAVMGVPTLLFLLPIFDTSMVTITRLMRGQSPAQGGTDHTSHRLIAFDLTERQAVLVLYGIALVSGIASASLEALDYDLSLVMFPLMLVVMALFAAYLARLKVVTAVSAPQSNISRLMMNLTYKRRLFELALDLLIVGICYYLAFWTRYGLDMTTLSMRLFLRSWPAAIGAADLAFYLFGVYRGVWRYIGADDLLRYAGGVAGGVALTWGVLLVVYPKHYSFEIFLLYAVFLYLGIAASRLSFLILDRLYSRQQGRTEKKAGVLLYGAGDAGELALRWILRNPDLGYRPLGFLDEDTLKWGRSIHGIDVLGGVRQLEGILAERQVTGVILALPVNDGDEALVEIVEKCRSRGIWVRRLRLAFELLE